MIRKTIQIEFASGKYRAADCINDIRDAVKSALPNLLARYGVHLTTPIVSNDYNGAHVLIDIHIPEQMADDFSIGNHLRGISAYLMKYCNGRYDDAKVGDRLFTYTEIPNLIDSYTLTDRMSLLMEIEEMLKNEDEETNEKICKIREVIRS